MREGYSQYISSLAWAKKRAERLEIDRNRCQTCHHDGSIYGLQVHHATYDRLFDEDVQRDLITLCTQCHDAITDVMRSRRGQGNVSVDVHVSVGFSRKGIDNGDSDCTVHAYVGRSPYQSQQPTGEPTQQVRQETVGDFQQAEEG